VSARMRKYTGNRDYLQIDEFLLRHYQSGNRDGNWLEPAWEYMHFHPLLDQSSLNKIGVWEDDGTMVGVCHYEWRLGEAFFQIHPAYRHLRVEMLDYAERFLFGRSRKDGRKYLCAYVDARDEEFKAVVTLRGYQRDKESDRPLSKLVIPEPFPAISLPDGFVLKSLADECDWAKVNRVLWRGFDNEGVAPASFEDIEERRKMFDTPKARRDLKIVAAAPDGEFAALCGMFYEPTHRYAYVEPVATDPAYRRLGLGKAVVLEGIRRCAELGAQQAYVGSNLEFYQALGFKIIYTNECWVKYLD
jgi:GNAT superfamily N-acetyltransferase